MKPEKLMKVIGDAADEYILSAMASRKNQTGKRRRPSSIILIAVLVMILLFSALGIFLASKGYRKQAEVTSPAVIATSPIEVGAKLLANVSATLPDGFSRETVSGIQHDFLKDGRQIGGIVIVDIPAEMFDSPRENTAAIAELLGKQLMPTVDEEEYKWQSAGGNSYAYLELATGKERARYAHHLFRGNTACYDIWFDLEVVKRRTMTEILSTVSSADIPAELNESPF